MDFRTVTIESLVADVRARRVSARELTAAALGNIERTQGTLNAFCAIDADAALAEADAIDTRLRRGDAVGALPGIPVGVKDLEDARGFTTTYGSALHVGDPAAAEDSPLVARLRAAGCVVLGKTNTPEFGYKAATDNIPFGSTRNPWNPAHTAGGSSGGSAAALAGGVVPLATGSDGGGSIRIPAAVCGFSGIKTSQGRVPTGGREPPGSGLMTVKGPMALTTRDTAMVLDVVRGDEPTDIFGLPGDERSWRRALDGDNRPRRAVFSPTLGYARLDSELETVLRAALDRIADAGVDVVERDDIWPEDPVRHWFVFWSAARARAQGHLRGTPAWEQIDPELRPQIEHGLDSATAVAYAMAIDACFKLNHRLTEVLDEDTLLLTPTVCGQTPRLGAGGLVDGEETPGWIGYTYGFNMTRSPAGTVNAGFTAAGMPVGVQIVGGQRRDLAVLSAMCFFEDLFAFPHDAPHGV